MNRICASSCTSIRPYAVRVSGLSVSTFQACFAGDTPHKKRSTQAGQQFDEFRLWQVLQKEDSSAAGIALWMSWQMGVQGKEPVSYTHLTLPTIRLV